MEPNIVFGLCLGCFIVGLALGYILFRGGDSASATQAEKAQAELAEYRTAVNEHFSETAEHFKALGRNYRDLYAHMARGSEALMGDGDTKLPFVPMEQLLAADDEEGPQEQSVVAEQSPEDSAPHGEAAAPQPDAPAAKADAPPGETARSEGNPDEQTSSDAFAEEPVDDPKPAADYVTDKAPGQRPA